MYNTRRSLIRLSFYSLTALPWRKGNCALAVALLLFAPPSTALDLWPFGKKGVKYETEIEGAPDDKLERYLKEHGVTPADKENPPQSVAEVGFLANSIGERYRKAMIANGYYDARVDLKIDESAKPVKLHYTIRSGPLYTIAAWRIDWKGAQLPLPDDKSLLPEIGKPATAERIANAGDRMQKKLFEKYCLLSLSFVPSAELNSQAHSATAVYTATPGPKANFGPTRISGNGTVSKDVVQKYIKWKEGECYQASKLNDTRADLIKSQLFASADVHAAEAPDEKGEAPITVALNQRAEHTVSLGASYTTDEGYGVTGHWEDRNFRGHAEKFSADATVSKLQYSIGPTYSIPYFYRDDQKLNLSANAAKENTDAYDSQNLTASATVERKLLPHLTAGLGVGARATDVEQFGDSERYGFLFIPAFLEWDNRNDTLDPKSGLFARGSVTPYSDVTGQGVSFLKSQLNAQTYFTAGEWPWEPTLAIRGAVGNISGAGVRQVPPDLRFYAGGGGSVRGYAYQALGPRVDNQPLGGTSWTEVSAEARLRFNETFGGVAFLDGGNVYDQGVPDVGQKLFWGTGLGVRYYSPIGPLRFDVAVPLDKREGDSAYEIYVSVGQSF